MKKILLINFVVFVTTLFIAIYIGSSQWLILTLAWFGITSIVTIRFLNNLNHREKVLFLFAAWFYPIFESSIKVFIEINLMKIGYDTLNTIEHFLWPIFFGIIIYPMLKSEISNINSNFIKLLLIIGVINLVGIFNEQFQFILRNIMNLKKDVYYLDTIMDLTLNFLGSVAISIFLVFSKLKNKIG